MRIGLLLCLLPVPILAASLPPTNHAQASDEEVIVVASREPIPRRDAGSGVTVISNADLTARNAEFLTDALRDVPGFEVARAGGIGKQTQVRVRGGEARHLLVLIDGVEANDFSRDDGFDFGHLMTGDIERVEIVRGPQSGLWGSDALAGVMNIITKQATKPVESHVAVEYGSFNTRLVNAGLGGKVESLAANLGFSHLESDGTNVSRAGTEKDGYRNDTLNLKLGWSPWDKLKIDLNARLADIDNQTDGDLGLGIPSDTPGITHTVQEYFGGRAVLTSVDGHWLNTVTSSLTRITNKDADAATNIAGGTAGTKNKIGYQSTFRFATDFGIAAQHSLTAAVDYERATFRQRGPVDINFGDPNQNHTFTSAGYVGEYRLTLAQHTHFGASGRFDDNHQFASIWTYRVSASQDIPRTDTVVSFAYATGQKAPLFTSLFGFSSGGNFNLPYIGNRALKPENSRGYEIGIVQPLLSDRITLNTTYFSERLTDEIQSFVADPAFTFFTAVNTPGTSTRDGLEFAVSGIVSPQLKLTGSYTYLEATELKDGKRVDEIRRPNHSGAASAAWQSSDARTGIALHLTVTGGRDDFFFEPSPPFQQLRERLTPYTLVSISASHQLTSCLALTARIENLADEQYEDVFGFQNPGVAGYLGVRVNFNR